MKQFLSQLLAIIVLPDFVWREGVGEIYVAKKLKKNEENSIITGSACYSRPKNTLTQDDDPLADIFIDAQWWIYI